jgi:hypothetical protein
MSNRILFDRQLRDLITRIDSAFRCLDALWLDDDVPDDIGEAIEDALPVLDAVTEFLVDLRDGRYAERAP